MEGKKIINQSFKKYKKIYRVCAFSIIYTNLNYIKNINKAYNSVDISQKFSFSFCLEIFSNVSPAGAHRKALSPETFV